MTELSCYHHHGRPAVATCAHCGKGLCEECADVLQTTDGDIFCVDCYKNVLNNNVRQVKKARRRIIAEFVFIIIGIILGIAISVIGDIFKQQGIALGIIIIFFFGSVGTIINQVRFARYKGWGWLWVLLYFVLMVCVCPIMTLYRIGMRIKDMVVLTRIVRSDREGAALAELYRKYASQADNEQAPDDIVDEKGNAIDIDNLMKELGQCVQVSADGSVSLERIANH